MGDDPFVDNVRCRGNRCRSSGGLGVMGRRHAFRTSAAVPTPPRLARLTFVDLRLGWSTLPIHRLIPATATSRSITVFFPFPSPLLFPGHGGRVWSRGGEAAGCGPGLRLLTCSEDCDATTDGGVGDTSGDTNARFRQQPRRNCGRYGTRALSSLHPLEVKLSANTHHL